MERIIVALVRIVSLIWIVSRLAIPLVLHRANTDAGIEQTVEEASLISVRESRASSIQAVAVQNLSVRSLQRKRMLSESVLLDLLESTDAVYYG